MDEKQAAYNILDADHCAFNDGNQLAKRPQRTSTWTKS